jgi:urocanate hydratase
MDDNFRASILRGIPDEIPSLPSEEPGISHAPPRRQVLNPVERRLALENALRYFPTHLHETACAGICRRAGHRWANLYAPLSARLSNVRSANHGISGSLPQAAAVMLMITTIWIRR